MDDNKEKNEKDIEKDNKENEIEVVIGDSSEINFSDVEDFVEELKPKVVKKSNIIIPGNKKKAENKDEEKKDEKNDK